MQQRLGPDLLADKAKLGSRRHVLAEVYLETSDWRTVDSTLSSIVPPSPQAESARRAIGASERAAKRIWGNSSGWLLPIWGGVRGFEGGWVSRRGAEGAGNSKKGTSYSVSPALREVGAVASWGIK